MVITKGAIMNILVFDIETVPDTETGRKLYNLDGLADEDVAQAMFNIRRQKTGGSEFLPHHLQRIVAISAVFRSPDTLNVWSLGEEDSGEAELVQRFFDGVDKFSPTLVSWNGGGFDLPVLHYRALKHKISAHRYWETGAEDNNFKWNNYISRYHSRHTDVMDILAMYTGRANAPLDEVSTMLGYPGKMGMSGSKVWDEFCGGNVKGIRNYCETDVLNTYLVYLRYELIRGMISHSELDIQEQRLMQWLETREETHFVEFLQAWRANL
jgi:hypothetical protein